jgi:hypothetical protein
MSGALQAVFQNLRSFLSIFGWFNSSTGGTRSYQGAVTKDSAGKIYSIGLIEDVSNNRKLTVSRFTSTGTADLNVSIGGTFAVAGDYYGVTVDSSSNIYAFIAEGSNNGIQLAKYNSSGTLQFQLKTTSSVRTIRPSQAVIDGSNNIFVAAFAELAGCYGSTYNLALVKYTTSGTVSWAYYYTAGAVANGVAYDSSGNLWVSGQLSGGSGKFVKVNSSGTATLSRDSSNTAFNGIAIDSSDNIYMVGIENSSSNNASTFNVSSAGAINWARKFVLGTSAGARNIAVDSSGNIYVVSVFSASGAPVYSAILKYNSSGTLQWQRTLKGPGNSTSYGLYAQDITTSNGNVIITGYQNTTGVSNAWYGFTVSVPTDGSLTGTIVNGGNSYVYAAGTGTESAGQTVTITTVSNSTTTLSASNATTTLTSTSNQLTNTVTTF